MTRVFKVNRSTSIPIAFLLFPTGVESFCLPASPRRIKKKKPYRNSEGLCRCGRGKSTGCFKRIDSVQSCVKPQWQMKLKLFIFFYLVNKESTVKSESLALSGSGTVCFQNSFKMFKKKYIYCDKSKQHLGHLGSR